MVVAGAASAFVSTRQHVDYLSIDNVGEPYKHDLRLAHNVGISNDLTGFLVEEGQAILRHVSKDFRYSGDYNLWPDVTNLFKYPGNKVSDKDFLVLYSPDARTYFNVPTSVIDILYGGNGTVDTNMNKDPNGFTLHKDHANEIVNKLALNPANGAHDEDGAILSVYMFSVDVSGGLKKYAKNTVVAPIGLNYEYFASNDRNAYFSVQAGRSVEYASSDIVVNLAVRQTTAYEVKDIFTAHRADTGALMLNMALGADAAAIDNASVDLFGTSRFTGMRARDVKLFKVYGDRLSGKQEPFVLVDSKAKLEHQKYIIVKSVVSLTPGAAAVTVTDTVLGPDDIITNDAPHRILFAVRDGTDNFDFTTPNSSGPMVDPLLVYAEYPFVKDPKIKGEGTFENTVEQVTKWGRIASLRGPGLRAYDPADAGWVMAYPEEVQAQFSGHNDYTALLRDTFALTGGFGSKKDNMVWLKDSVITEQYGFELENVHQFPMTLGDLSARQNTGVIVFSIREPEKFIGKKVSDVRVYNATGKDFADPQKYVQVYNKTDLQNGTFAVLQRDPDYPAANWDTPYDQVIMGADDEFVEGQAYFIALAAKDGGDFDVQQGRQGIEDTKNDRVVHYAAFAVVGGSAPKDPTLVVTPASASMKPGESQTFTAKVENSDKTFGFKWSSDNTDVATVGEDDGVVVAVKVGEAKIKCVATEVATAAGIAEEPLTKEVTVTVAQDAPSGGSSGGCSVGGFAPATLLLLAPLFLLLKK